MQDLTPLGPLGGGSEAAHAEAEVVDALGDELDLVADGERVGRPVHDAREDRVAELDEREHLGRAEAQGALLRREGVQAPAARELDPFGLSVAGGTARAGREAGRAARGAARRRRGALLEPAQELARHRVAVAVQVLAGRDRHHSASRIATPAPFISPCSAWSSPACAPSTPRSPARPVSCSKISPTSSSGVAWGGWPSESRPPLRLTWSSSPRAAAAAASPRSHSPIAS